jgi:hypothetical protein
MSIHPFCECACDPVQALKRVASGHNSPALFASLIALAEGGAKVMVCKAPHGVETTLQHTGQFDFSFQPE